MNNLWPECTGVNLHTNMDLTLPTRERGLKFSDYGTVARMLYVAPHAGAWIEISITITADIYSHVAPHAGAWIEIVVAMLLPKATTGRSPRGSVD